MIAPHVVLASTSRYRAALLRRVLDTFEQVAPAVAENELADETPARRATRLAAAKARAVAARRSNALVIGSDQVASLGARILHKPGSAANALAQLRASSGKCVTFYTGLCVIDTRNGAELKALDRTRAVFRTLADTEIRRYLEREHPLDCAGSFKAEAAGIALFERIESKDPTALVGLPLIALARLLRTCGMRLP